MSNPVSCKSPIEGSQHPAPRRTGRTGVNPGSASPTRAAGRNPCHLQLDPPLKTSSRAGAGAGATPCFGEALLTAPGRTPKREAEVSSCVRAADEIILITFQKEEEKRGERKKKKEKKKRGKKKRKRGGRSLVEDLRRAFKAAELGLQARIKECPFVPTHLSLRHNKTNFF